MIFFGQVMHKTTLSYVIIQSGLSNLHGVRPFIVFLSILQEAMQFIHSGEYPVDKCVKYRHSRLVKVDQSSRAEIHFIEKLL